MAGQSKLDEALGTHVVLDSTNIPDDIIVEADIGPGAITDTELASNAVTNIKVAAAADIAVSKLAAGTANHVVKTNSAGTAVESGLLQSENVDVFKSGTLTGTGTEQSTAHGLGRTPALVLVLMAEGGVSGQVVEGTHDGTSCLVTAPSGMDYKIVAL